MSGYLRFYITLFFSFLSMTQSQCLACEVSDKLIKELKNKNIKFIAAVTDPGKIIENISELVENLPQESKADRKVQLISDLTAANAKIEFLFSTISLEDKSLLSANFFATKTWEDLLSGFIYYPLHKKGVPQINYEAQVDLLQQKIMPQDPFFELYRHIVMSPRFALLRRADGEEESSTIFERSQRILKVFEDIKEKRWWSSPSDPRHVRAYFRVFKIYEHFFLDDSSGSSSATSEASTHTSCSLASRLRILEGLETIIPYFLAATRCSDNKSACLQAAYEKVCKKNTVCPQDTLPTKIYKFVSELKQRALNEAIETALISTSGDIASSIAATRAYYSPFLGLEYEAGSYHDMKIDVNDQLKESLSTIRIFSQLKHHFLQDVCREFLGKELSQALSLESQYFLFTNYLLFLDVFRIGETLNLPNFSGEISHIDHSFQVATPAY